jgi:hypothetical protein
MTADDSSTGRQHPWHSTLGPILIAASVPVGRTISATIV